MKKLVETLFCISTALIVSLLVLTIAQGCKKDKKEECYECKNLDQEIVQTYCGVTQGEADGMAALWSLNEIQSLNPKAMSPERYEREKRKVTISGCKRK